MVQVDSALPVAGVISLHRTCQMLEYIRQLILKPCEEQMFHGFAMNPMAKGLVIEVTAESPKQLTLKE